MYIPEIKFCLKTPKDISQQLPDDIKLRYKKIDIQILGFRWELYFSPKNLIPISFEIKPVYQRMSRSKFY